MKLQRATSALGAATLFLAGCAGGSLSPVSGVGNANQARVGAARSASKIVVTPASLSFTSSGVKKKIAVSEAGYRGTFTASTAAKGCTGVVTVKPAGAAKKFTVTSASKAGTCKITVSDKQGNHAVVNAVVTLTRGSIH